MTSATIKRGTRKPANKRPNSSRIKRVSTIDRAMRAMPVTEQQIQRGLSWGLAGVFLIGAYAAAHYMGFVAMAGQEIAAATSRAGFEVKRIEVQGVERIDELKVYETALAQKDRAMVQVDAEALRQKLMENGWVKDARVSKRLPETLVVEIIERKPIAVWQQNGHLALIDEEGHVLEKIRQSQMPDLPVVVGKKANLQIESLRKLLDAAPALKPQVAAATWVGNRRWDLQFASGETLALPEGETTAAAALLNFARLDGVNRLLGKGVAHFDLRDGERAYLRMKKEQAAEEADGAETTKG